MNCDFVYDRVSNQAIRSMAFLFFNEIEKCELESKHLNDGIVVKEANDFLNQISKLYLDIEDELPIAGSALDNVKKILVSELSMFDSISENVYQEKIRRYIKSSYPYYMEVLFDEVIDKAIERNEMYSEYKKDPTKYADVICKLIKEIIEIYDKENGDPKVRPNIACPICKKEANNYMCVWDLNKHVHYYCDNCEFSFSQ